MWPFQTRADEHTGITADALGSRLREWFKAGNFGAVDFIENFAREEGLDYVLVYQAKFLPLFRTQMTVEVWLTDDGYIAVGIENRIRVARHLNVPCTRKWEFADGFEPIRVDIPDLLSLLDEVASGRVLIRARALPLFGLRATGVLFGRKAGLHDSELARHLNTRISPLFTVDLTYEPWA